MIKMLWKMEKDLYRMWLKNNSGKEYWFRRNLCKSDERMKIKKGRVKWKEEYWIKNGRKWKEMLFKFV
jgi:hypothetical protein